LGQLTAEKMADELTSANVFVIPSLIENSPNSLAEAMIVGTPTVSSFVGGIPSMVRDNETSLCFPPGDEKVMAERINMIFRDDMLAVRLSEEAQKTAHKRHDRHTIVTTMLIIYRSLCV
jgi:glycosyltransferase involved in cell wall biosynthesis